MKISVTLRKKQNTTKTASLYLDIQRPSYKRERKFLGLTLTGNKIQDKITLRNAEEIRIKTLSELQKDVHSLVVESKITLGQLIEKSIERDHITPATISNIRNVEVKLIDFDKNSLTKKISTITPEYLDSFKSYLEKGKLKKNSLRTYLIVMKSFFNLAIKKRYLTKNPALHLELPKKVTPEKEFLTIPELRILEAIEHKPETLRAFLFACYTGLRISDIRKLKYEDISEGTIKVKMQKTKDFVYIPLTEKAKELINTKILNHSGNIFTLQTPMTINTQLKILFMKYGIQKDKVSFHMSRHTFATIGLTIGIPIEVISKLLGHKDLSTTQIYAKIVNEKVVKEMDKFNQL